MCPPMLGHGSVAAVHTMTGDSQGIFDRPKFLAVRVHSNEKTYGFSNDEQYYIGTSNIIFDPIFGLPVSFGAWVPILAV